MPRRPAQTKNQGGYDLEFIARALVQASIEGDDEKTAKKLGVSPRSIVRWRQRVLTDANLAELVREKRAAADGDWARDLPRAITKAIDFLADAPNHLDKKDPDSVRAVAGAMKLLTETAMSRRVLDARLSHAPRPLGEEPGQGSSSAEEDEGDEAGTGSSAEH